MKLQKMEVSEVDRVFTRLRGLEDIEISFNQPYLELVAGSDILDILYTPDFSSVFLKYKTSEETSFEEWISDRPVKAAEKLVSEYGSNTKIGFQRKETGEKLGWKYKTDTFEMCREPPSRDSEKVEKLGENELEAAVELMTQEWWNRSEAENYLRTALEVKNSVLKAVKSKGNLVAVGQVSVSEKLGWIAVTYVDSNNRGQGFGSKLVRSLGKEAEKEGAGKVCLGAETETGAVKFYRKLGFEPTEFKVYDFSYPG